mgnify:CR=1 FL=1
MGKFFIRVGMTIQRLWYKFQCNWNLRLSKLMFSVKSCPNNECVCKK